jgi:hypothetical protein
MRTFALRALAGGVAVLLAYPALAQFPGGGRGGMMEGPALLLNKSVQDELKLTDEQKAELQKAQEKIGAAFQAARQSGDREKAKGAFDDARKVAEKVQEGLKPEQAKRFKQIQLQAEGVQAFAKADVQKELNLSDKQKEEIKEIGEGVRRDAQELFQGAQGDREKMREVGKKVQALRTEAMDKVSGVLTDTQKKTWKEMTGEKFEVRREQGPGGPGGGGRRRQGNNQQAPKPD